MVSPMLICCDNSAMQLRRMISGFLAVFCAGIFVSTASSNAATENSRDLLAPPKLSQRKEPLPSLNPVQHLPIGETPKSLNSIPPSPKSPEAIGKPPAETPITVLRDTTKLPVPAARMRELILEAAKSGDIERLRPLIGFGQSITSLSLGGFDGDPIEFLKSLSGDSEGHEILAILIEVLEAGFSHVDQATENELFVWPYFYSMPLNALSAPQKVELYKLVTAGDYEDMNLFGAYIFYRVGITPKGRWQFFVAGD